MSNVGTSFVSIENVLTLHFLLSKKVPNLLGHKNTHKRFKRGLCIKIFIGTSD